MNEPTMTTADHLRSVIDQWHSFYDDAARWQERVDAAVAAAEVHLNPTLAEDDPAPAVRCLP